MSAFTDALSSDPVLSQARLVGKQALKGEHREQITCRTAKRITDSIDLDDAMKPRQPNAARWDYGLGYTTKDGKAETAVWVEVHPARTSNVKEVLAKLDWLKDFLKSNAPDLNALTERVPANVGAYHWVATKATVNIPRNSKERRQLNEAGLKMPRHRLELP